MELGALSSAVVCFMSPTALCIVLVANPTIHPPPFTFSPAVSADLHSLYTFIFVMVVSSSSSCAYCRSSRGFIVLPIANVCSPQIVTFICCGFALCFVSYALRSFEIVRNTHNAKRRRRRVMFSGHLFVFALGSFDGWRASCQCEHNEGIYHF